jgi:hypothetical protein
MVAYLDTPGDLLSVLVRHSVHSRVITMRTPFLLAIVLIQEIRDMYTFTYIDMQLTIFAYDA